MDTFTNYIIGKKHITYRTVTEDKREYDSLPDRLFDLNMSKITKAGNNYNFEITIIFWREYQAKLNKAKFNFTGEGEYTIPTVNGTLLDNLNTEEAILCIAECIYHLQTEMKAFFEDKQPNLSVVFPLQSKEDILTATRNLLNRTDKKRTTIEYLKQLQRHAYNKDYENISRELDGYIPSLPISITTIDKLPRPTAHNLAGYSLIYRARANETLIPERGTMELPFRTVKEISIIQECEKNKLKHYGRCNKCYEPRFYAATNEFTACSEAITNGFIKDEPASKFCTVGIWKIIEPLNLAIINYSEKYLRQFLEMGTDNSRYEAMIEHARKVNEDRIKRISVDTDQDVEHLRQILEIFSDEFAKIEIKDDYDYYLSNYYCDHIFDKSVLEDGHSKVDGILYPSAKFSYQHYNIVLHPRAMRKIKFISAMMVQIAYFPKDSSFQLIPLEERVQADAEGNLQWRKFKW